jgi:hypothetical protein
MRTTKSEKIPFRWRVASSGLVEVVQNGNRDSILYVELMSPAEGVFGTSENNRTVKIHPK